MDCRLPTAAYLPVTCPRKGINRKKSKTCCLLCCAKIRGFGTEPTKKAKASNTETPKENTPITSEPSKVSSGALRTRKKNALELQGNTGGKSHGLILDRQFLEKVESVRRSVYEQKKAEEDKFSLPIDYNAPIESEQSKNGLGLKVGVGIAVVVFGLVFTFGDYFPSGSNIPSADKTVIEKKLSEKEKTTLKEALRQFEETLIKSPKDPAALEGEAVTLVELGEYQRASSLLQKLLKETPENVDAFRLLGEVKYQLKDYEGSASAYRSYLSISKSLNFEVLRELTNALLAAKKPDEAVQMLLSSRANIVEVENIGLSESINKLNDMDRKVQEIDPIQAKQRFTPSIKSLTLRAMDYEGQRRRNRIDLLLGKAYSDWGHVSDAVAVYDHIISKHPDDFRGYLAKAIILKENGKVGDAERMFIQARFYAPEKAKAFVDRYSRQ